MPEPEVNINETMSRITGVLSRRRWWIALTATAVALATILVSLKLPNKYLSDATLMVVQQQISTRFVEPDSTRTAADVNRQIVSFQSAVSDASLRTALPSSW